MLQTLFFGDGSLERLADVIQELKPKRLFLVTGKKSYSVSGAEKRINKIIKNIESTRYSSFSSNPNIEDVKKGINLFKIKPFNMIIAVGGGSVIDMAKSILFLSTQKKEVESAVIYSDYADINTNAVLVAIPTTAGTGSEATTFAVVYINKIKYSIEHESILPKVVIVDPKLLYPLDPYTDACAGADALCQCIESLWSINSTETSREFALEALKRLFTNIKSSVLEKSKSAKSEMALGAYQCGKAINISRTTAAHSVSYPLTSLYNIPHGHAVALTIHKFLVFNSLLNSRNCQDKRGIVHVKNVIGQITKVIGADDALQAATILKALFQNIGLEMSLKKLGLSGSSIIETVINNGFKNNRMKNNPREVTRDDLRLIFEEL